MTVTNSDVDDNKHFDKSSTMLEQILNTIQIAREEIQSLQKSISRLKIDLYDNNVLRFRQNIRRKEVFDNDI